MTRTVLLGDIVLINPTTTLKKGTSSKFVSMDKLDPFKRKISGYEERKYKGGTKFMNDDTLLARITPCLENGKTAFVDILGDEEVGTGSTEFIVLRAINGVTDSDYVYYLSMSPEFRNYAIQAMIGTSGRQRVQNNILARYELELPDIETQKKIGEQLRTIDEKIELNRQMNETLEQMGQALFRHYFIDNPEAEGWGVTTLGCDIKPKRGKSLQSKNMKPGDVAVVSGGLQPAGLHNESNTIAPVITISASGANAGFTALWGQNIWSADSSFIDTTITPNVYFYYILLSRNQKRIYEMQTGSGQPHIYPSHIEMLDMPNAPDKLIAEFNDQITTYFEKIEQNKQQIQTLTTLRDMLLPRLISGKVKA